MKNGDKVTIHSLIKEGTNTTFNNQLQKEKEQKETGKSLEACKRRDKGKKGYKANTCVNTWFISSSPEKGARSCKEFEERIGNYKKN